MLEVNKYMSYTEETVRIDPKARKIVDLQAGGQAVNFNTTSDVTLSASLDAAGGANDKTTFTITLSNVYALKCFGIPIFALYESSVAANNQIPNGSAVNPSNYRLFWWIDYQSTDGNNVKLKVFVQNLSAGAKTVYLKGNFKYLLESSSAA